ncbi:hypothetical protein AZ268_gp42 [Acidianus rod-shaped virus 2]|uniref:Uncharacterized protein n=1 Tax=Acidianus rod-shaped virus 2 TaxID=1732175 RepID=A0A0N9NID3_9VIRU|nr:hypothetical protein AZ268_gp42 [Acidianus rod-shaped virus 2]ALG96910.1 hypothetical protein [Acidianus rod-shaped virus 2]
METNELSENEIKKIIDEPNLSAYDIKSFNVDNEDKKLRNMEPESEYRKMIFFSLFNINIEKMINAYLENNAKYYYMVSVYYWNNKPKTVVLTQYKIKRVLAILYFDEVVDKIKQSDKTEIDPELWEDLKYRIWHFPLFGKYDRTLEEWYLYRFFAMGEKKDKDDIMYMSVTTNLLKESTLCYSPEIKRYVTCFFKDSLEQIDKDVAKILNMKIL